MDFRKHHQLRSPLVSPMGYLLTSPIVDMTGATPVVGPHGLILMKLFSPTMDASGITWQNVLGQIAQTLRPIQQNAVGLAGMIGSINQMLRPIIQTASGGQDTDAVVTQLLHGIFQNAVGFEQHGVIEQTLYKLIQQAAGTSLTQGEIAMLLPLIAQQVNGFVNHAEIAQTLLGIIQNATGGMEGIAQIVQTLGQIFQNGVVVVQQNEHGTITQTLLPLSQEARGWRNIEGHIGQVLGLLRHSSSGTVVGTIGTINQTLYPVILDAEGHVANVSGRIQQVLPKIIMAGEGSRTNTIIQRLYVLRQEVIAGMEAFGTAGPMILQFYVVNESGEIINMNARGDVSTSGPIRFFLGPISMAANGNAFDAEGAIIQSLHGIKQDLSGSSDQISRIIQKLSGVYQDINAVTAPDLRFGDIRQTIVQKFDTLGHLVQWISSDAEVYVSPVGDSEVVLHFVQQRADGFQSPIFGTANQKLARFLQEVDGVEIFPGSIPTMRLEGIFNRTTGEIINDGAIFLRLFSISQSTSVGWAEALGPIHQTLRQVGISGGGGPVYSGPIAQTLFAPTQNASGLGGGNHGPIVQRLFGIRQFATDGKGLNLAMLFSIETEIATTVWTDFSLGINGANANLLNTLSLEAVGF